MERTAWFKNVIPIQALKHTQLAALYNNVTNSSAMKVIHKHLMQYQRTINELLMQFEGAINE